MKTLLLLLVLVGWFAPAQPTLAQTTTKETKKADFYYTCSMHPEVHSDKPGSCPICHMALIKKYVDKEASQGPMLETSQVDGRKTIKLDQATFSVSGAKPHRVEAKDASFTVRAFGKIVSPSRFSLQIAEVDLPFVKVGQPVLLTSPSISFTQFHGKITSIDYNLEPMGKTVRAEGSFGEKSALRAESTVIAAIEIKKQDIVTIPEDAILHSSTTDYVFVYEQKTSTLVPTKVSVGIGSNGQVEILSGLRPGMVITRGANFLLDSEARMQFSYDQKNN